MKKEMRIVCAFALVLFLIVPSATASFAQTSDTKALLGTWDIQVIEMGLQMQFVFKIVEEAVTGELVFEMGSGKMTDIKLEKNELSSFVTLDVGGQLISVDITGTIDGENIAGFMNSDMGTVQYTGTKSKEK
jgi:hypothetical protein